MGRSSLLLVLALSACGGPVYEFDPIAAGKDDMRQPRALSSTQFVRAIYSDIVGRAPAVYTFVVEDANGAEQNRFTIDEQQQLVDVLDSIGDAAPLRDLLAQGLLDSGQSSWPDKSAVSKPEDWISSQFRRFLGREASPYELRAFVDAWKNDPYTGPQTIVRALVGSREYLSY
jgi:hypothetical protein